eukprot:954495-Pyramimonas_sp.AAC.1
MVFGDMRAFASAFRTSASATTATTSTTWSAAAFTRLPNTLAALVAVCVEAVPEARGRTGA